MLPNVLFSAVLAVIVPFRTN